MNPMDSTGLVVGLIVVVLGVLVALAMLDVPEAVWLWDQILGVFR